MARGVLHRDISCGNILILDGNQGVLNDWDMCKYEGEEIDFHSPTFRVVYSFLTYQRPWTQKLIRLQGTWHFMSALLLKSPDKVHEVPHDIESFVHVINCLILRFHRDQKTRHSLLCAVFRYTERGRTPTADIEVV